MHLRIMKKGTLLYNFLCVLYRGARLSEKRQAIEVFISVIEAVISALFGQTVSEVQLLL